MLITGQRRTLPPAMAETIRQFSVPRSPGATVSSWRTKQLLRALLNEEWTHEQLAGYLGRPARAIRHLRPRIRAKHEYAMEALYERLMGEVWTPPTLTYTDRD